MAKRKSAAIQLKPVISSLELMALETSRESLSLLKKQVRESEERVKAMEADLITRLEAGAVVIGDAQASIKEVEGQCRPEWKNVYLTHMDCSHGVPSEVAEERIRKETDVPTKKTLVIMDRADLLPL